MTNYFREAFGGFAPETDPNAAVKFVLTLLMMDRSLDRLLPLLEADPQIGGIAGDPGWDLERRHPAPPVASAYTDWPTWAAYRVYVEPEGYQLEYPETFYDERAFAGYLWVALAVYGRHHPEDMPLVARLLDLLPKRPAPEAAEVG